MKAVRQNGQILATDVSSGKIYLVDPQNLHCEPPVVAQLPNNSHVTGIAEVQEDVFYTQSVDGNLYEFEFQQNTTAIWKVDMRDYSKTHRASLRKAVELPAVGVPNGMALLSKDEGTILTADSTRGLIWRTNIYTGASEIVFDNALLKPIAKDHPAFGVDGVRVVDSTLYFTNTNYGLIAKVPISKTGYPIGSPLVMSSDVPNADDFAIDSRGNIWIAENEKNALVRVASDGQVQTIVGGQNSTALIGPVLAVFGHGCDDRDILYIGTDGLTVSATGKPLTTNGKIAAIDTRGF